MELINTIIFEMGKGNFSFLILIVGVLQLIIMILNMVANIKTHKIKKEEHDNEI